MINNRITWILNQRLNNTDYKLIYIYSIQIWCTALRYIYIYIHDMNDCIVIRWMKKCTQIGVERIVHSCNMNECYRVWFLGFFFVKSIVHFQTRYTEQLRVISNIQCSSVLVFHVSGSEKLLLIIYYMYMINPNISDDNSCFKIWLKSVISGLNLFFCWLCVHVFKNH